MAMYEDDMNLDDPEYARFLQKRRELAERRLSPESYMSQLEGADSMQAGVDQANFMEQLSKAGSKMGTLGGKSAESSLGGMGKARQDSVNSYLSQISQADKQRAGAEQDIDKVYQYLGRNKAEMAKANAMRSEKEAERQHELSMIGKKQSHERSMASLLGKDQPKEGKAPKDLFEKPNKEFNQRAESIYDNIDKLKNNIKKTGTFEMFGPADAEKDSLIYQIAVDYAKIVDPESVAREGEVAAAQKYMLPVKGLFIDNRTADQSIENFKRDMADRIRARQRSMETYVPNESLLSRLGSPNEKPGSGTAIASGQQKTVVKKQRSPSTGKVRVIYSDGSTEVKDE